MTLHKEGKTTLIFSFLVLSLLNYGIQKTEISWLIWTIGILSGIIFLIILQFFRSPNLRVEINENHLYAPADGKIVVIEKVQENEYFKDQRVQVSIFMSPFNVHSNRYPISGKVTYVKYHPGLFLMAWHPKSSTDNERNVVVVKNLKGVEIMCTQIAGFLARRICCYAKKDAEAKQGEEFGFIKFGSRVDVFLPENTEVLVNLEQKVKAGKTILAKI